MDDNVDDDVEMEKSRVFFGKKTKPNCRLELKDIGLKPLPPLYVPNIIMGVGPTHVVTYHVDSGVFYLHSWTKEAIHEGIELKEWPPLEDNTLPIIEIHEDYVFRADTNAFVYVSDITTGLLQFRVRCTRERDDGNLDVFTVRAATITNSAIVLVSSPSIDTSVVIVCADWIYGNSRCVFVESRIANINSVIATSLTKFVFTSSIGMCQLVVSVGDPTAWVVLPLASINEPLVKTRYEKEYKERERLYIEQYNKAIIEGSAIDYDNVRAIASMVFPTLSSAKALVHCHHRDGYTMVSSKFFYHVKPENAAILSESERVRNEDTDFIACVNIGDYFVAMTDEAELVLLGKTGRQSMSILSYYSTKLQSDHELISHSSCPPAAVFTLCGSILAVSLFQKSLFLFDITHG